MRTEQSSRRAAADGRLTIMPIARTTGRWSPKWLDLGPRMGSIVKLMSKRPYWIKLFVAVAIVFANGFGGFAAHAVHWHGDNGHQHSQATQSEDGLGQLGQDSPVGHAPIQTGNECADAHCCSAAVPPAPSTHSLPLASGNVFADRCSDLYASGSLDSLLRPPRPIT